MSIPRSRLACGFARANLALTIAAALIIVGGLLFRVRGGAERRLVDLVQRVAFWGYLVLTPVLAASGLLHRSASRRCTVTTWVLLGFWACVLIAGTFVHL